MHMLSTTGAIAPKQNVAAAATLTPTALNLYSALRSVAEIVKQHRGYHSGVTQVTFFCPLEVVAVAIGVSRRTVYYRLRELETAGLVSQRGHYCRHNSQTRMDGSLWAVRMNPGETRAAVKIDHDYLKGHYRNLGEDIANGKTAWSLVKGKLAQSNQRRQERVDTDLILSYAITPTLKNSNTNDCAKTERTELESLLDVPYAEQKAVNEAVDLAAHAVGAALGSGQGSINMWRWLVWALLRLEKAQGKDYFYQIYLLIQRAGVDYREGAARNGGGLFVSRLKASALWGELRGAPLVRVGTRPIKA